MKMKLLNKVIPAFKFEATRCASITVKKKKRKNLQHTKGTGVQRCSVAHAEKKVGILRSKYAVFRGIRQTNYFVKPSNLTAAAALPLFVKTGNIALFFIKITY